MEGTAEKNERDQDGEKILAILYDCKNGELRDQWRDFLKDRHDQAKKGIKVGRKRISIIV